MLSALLASAINKINSVSTLSELEQVRVEFVGKNGSITEHMKLLAKMPNEEKKIYGQQVNEIRNQVDAALFARKKILNDKVLKLKLESERIDITLSGRQIKQGSIHPISQACHELTEIFARFGFNVKEGPSIETDWYNFTALNIDEHHPARQDHDTFYMTADEKKMRKVLRTHTSPVEIRTMESGNPPFRFISPGRTYRSDYDQTHTPMFHQIELMAVDKEISMANLKYIIIEFIQAFFEGQNPEVRFRPSFFPFTTPSAEVDIRFKDGKWLEVLGCGMTHPNVLRNANIDSAIYQGFAAGLGIERMAMLKYGISDLRQFFESDIRWLEHYSFSSFDVPSIIRGLSR